jgi:hypothetical protein
LHWDPWLEPFYGQFADHAFVLAEGLFVDDVLAAGDLVLAADGIVLLSVRMVGPFLLVRALDGDDITDLRKRESLDVLAQVEVLLPFDDGGFPDD